MSEEKEIEFSDWFIKLAPKTIDDIYGQDVIVKALKVQMKKNEFPKATFLQGNFGNAKTSLAKIISKSIACKNKDADGNPCNCCPTCTTINDETYKRDVIYMNATEESADDVRKKLELAMMGPAIRDAAKVIICDEAQALSKEAVEAFLEATQSPKKGVFFIFTAMDKLQGPKAGALMSRCRVWKMKQPKFDEIYMYMASIAKRLKLTEDQNVPKEFWSEPLKFLAENSEYSFRKAIQLLQQCYEGQIFTIPEMKQAFNIVSNDDATKMLIDVCNGQLTETVWDTLNGMDFQDKFNLLMLVIGEAQQFKAFGYKFIDDAEKWKWDNKAKLANSPGFEKLRDGMVELSSRPYLKRGDYKIVLSKIIIDINAKPVGVTSGRHRPASA